MSMDLGLKSGRYVVAVSGGVDSVALLHALTKLSGVKLTVAHFDHGIREDSMLDRKFVQKLARSYSLPFVYDEAHLGDGISEAVARRARYDFLKRVQKASGATAIITAHHQDDALETAILNIMRGTGRKGLSSLGNHHDLKRPLLKVPKDAIKYYAINNNLDWREDSTNQDQKYLRNYVRHSILPRLDESARAKLVDAITKSHEINRELDSLLTTQLHLQSTARQLDRRWFNQLPHAVAREVLASWLRAHDIRDFDSKTLERLVVAAKTTTPHKMIDVVNSWSLLADDVKLALTPADR